MEALIAERSRETTTPNIPFKKLLERYVDEVSITKRSERWERFRAEAIGKMPIGDVSLPDLDETVIATWRDERLKSVSPATVNRE